MIKYYLIAFSLVFITGCRPGPSALRLPAIISDHLVLQQNRSVALWGIARPGSTVDAQASWGDKQQVVVAADSSWMLKLVTVKAGGPYEITLVNDDSTRVLRDVLLGEVWLCSGQSNMEITLSGWPPRDTIKNSATEIANANYSAIRFFNVARSASALPLSFISGAWQTCTPSSAATFSATGYFFGRKLHQALHVPIGLISSSWGGTPAESWVSANALSKDEDFKAVVDKLPELPAMEKAYLVWLNSHPQIDVQAKVVGTDPIIGTTFYDDQCASVGLNDLSWTNFSIPGNIESTSIGPFDGVVWFRKVVNIPASWKGRELKLNLGAIDDRDVTFFNGVRVGAHEQADQWNVLRSYTIPASLVKVGDNLIAFRMMDLQAAGSILGNDKTIALQASASKSIPLTGAWKHKVVAEYRDSIFYLFDPTKEAFANRPKACLQQGPYVPSMLYNGMIAPLVNYSVNGVVWYQGESNVGRAKQYSRLFPMLIKSWRRAFCNDSLPFYFVQIAPWHYEGSDDVNGAKLRDAQRLTLDVGFTGMAVTLDIGSDSTIHPPNKQDVGSRLALWALAKLYNQPIVFSGPVLEGMTLEPNGVRLFFGSIGSGLTLKEDGVGSFEIAGSDSLFFAANALVQTNTVHLHSAKVKSPTMARYLYHINSKATLYNREGLPAASFISSSEYLK